MSIVATVAALTFSKCYIEVTLCFPQQAHVGFSKVLSPSNHSSATRTARIMSKGMSPAAMPPPAAAACPATPPAASPTPTGAALPPLHIRIPGSGPPATAADLGRVSMLPAAAVATATAMVARRSCSRHGTMSSCNSIRSRCAISRMGALEVCKILAGESAGALLT